MAGTEAEFNLSVFETLLTRAEPRLKELLAMEGVSDLDELDQETARTIFRKAIVETAVAVMPDAEIKNLDRSLKNLTHPQLARSYKKAKRFADDDKDAFGIVKGIDCAVFLSGIGLPVVPLDRKTRKPLTHPSTDVDQAIRSFSKAKTAVVGYSSCSAPFYFLYTDCIRTLHFALKHEPKLKSLRQIIEASGIPFPSGGQRAFEHGSAVFGRKPEHKIESVILFDPDPNRGSIGLLAGWMEGNRAMGSFDDDFVPVPTQLLRAAFNDPNIVGWLREPDRAPLYKN